MSSLQISHIRAFIATCCDEEFRIPIVVDAPKLARSGSIQVDLAITSLEHPEVQRYLDHICQEKEHTDG